MLQKLQTPLRMKPWFCTQYALGTRHFYKFESHQPQMLCLAPPYRFHNSVSTLELSEDSQQELRVSLPAWLVKFRVLLLHSGLGNSPRSRFIHWMGQMLILSISPSRLATS